MSIARCASHDISFDTDFNVACPLCEAEQPDWKAVEQCWLSGQMTHAEMSERLTSNPEFREWFLERLKRRA